MKYCKNCDLKFDTDLNKCLFCSNQLEVINDECSSAFPKRSTTFKVFALVKKILALSLLLLIATSIMIDIYLDFKQNFWILVLFSSVYVYVVFSIIVRVEKSLMYKFFNISLLSALESFGVFLFFSLGIESLYLPFVYPGIIMATFVGLLIIYFLEKNKTNSENLIYIFLNFFWGLSTILIAVSKSLTFTLINSICIIITIFVGLSFVIFFISESKEEIKKRLHF